jgi:uncharacterized lipoprotein YddW (UPF0748 family)
MSEKDTQAFIEEARIQGLKVNASINTFVGGYLCPYNLGHDGVLFRDESKKGWASVANLADGLTNTMDLLDDETDYGAKFFNPANDDVQNFVLQLLADLAKYDLDGIILDRCRYDDYGLESDFSDISKQKFEEYIGETVANFPADIMAPGTDEIPSDQPVYFKKWLEFRAKVIHDFIALLFLFDKVCTSIETKKHTYETLHDLFHQKFTRNKSFFETNEVLISSYEFVVKIVDFLYNSAYTI